MAHEQTIEAQPSPQAPVVPRALKIWIFSALTVFLLSALALVVITLARPKVATGGNGFDDVSFGRFELLAQDGKSVNQEILAGKVSIVDFVFTHCQLACPRMSLEMAKLTRRLADTPVQFVSFSLDPRHDTPQKLGAWAEEWAKRADGTTAKWTLLTEPPGADRGVVRNMLTAGLKMHVADDPTNAITLEDGSTMPNIRHPVDFFLVGPDGRIVGRFGSTRAEELDELVESARALIQKQR